MKSLNVTQPISMKQQSGVLLIEVLFSILIFSVGILGLVGMQAIATKNAIGAEDRTIAASLANDFVAQMWLRKSVDTATDPLKTDFANWKTRVTGSAGANRFQTPTVTTTNGVTTVTITWQTPKTSGGSSTMMTHTYTTQFSM